MPKQLFIMPMKRGERTNGAMVTKPAYTEGITAYSSTGVHQLPFGEHYIGVFEGPKSVLDDIASKPDVVTLEDVRSSEVAGWLNVKHNRTRSFNDWVRALNYEREGLRR